MPKPPIIKQPRVNQDHVRCWHLKEAMELMKTNNPTFSMSIMIENESKNVVKEGDKLYVINEFANPMLDRPSFSSPEPKSALLLQAVTRYGFLGAEHGSFD